MDNFLHRAFSFATFRETTPLWDVGFVGCAMLGCVDALEGCVGGIA